MKVPKGHTTKKPIAAYPTLDIAKVIEDRAADFEWSASKYTTAVLEYWKDLGFPQVHPLEANYTHPQLLTITSRVKDLLNDHEIEYLLDRATAAAVDLPTFVAAIIDDWFTKGTPPLDGLESPKKESVDFARREGDPDLPGEVAEDEFPYNEAQSVQLMGKVLHELNIPMEKAELALRTMILQFVEKHDDILREKPPENGS